MALGWSSDSEDIDPHFIKHVSERSESAIHRIRQRIQFGGVNVTDIEIQNVSFGFELDQRCQMTLPPSAMPYETNCSVQVLTPYL